MTPDLITMLVLLQRHGLLAVFGQFDPVTASAAEARSGVMALDGTGWLAGAAGASQRIADALRIVRGTYPLARGYGARLTLDRRPAAIYSAVADAFAQAGNGLSDLELESVRLDIDDGKVVVEVIAAWRSAAPSGPPAAGPVAVRVALAEAG